MILIHLPEKARGEGICFSWSQAGLQPDMDILSPAVKKPVGINRIYTRTTPHIQTTTSTSPHRTTRAQKADQITTSTEKQTTPYTYQSTFDPDWLPGNYTSRPFYEMYEYEIAPVIPQDQPANDYLSDDDSLGTKTGTKFTKTEKGTKKGGKPGVFAENDKVLGNSDSEADGTFAGCWAIDQVIIVNSANAPTTLEDSFEPVDPSQWLLLPGAHFKVRSL